VATGHYSESENGQVPVSHSNLCLFLTLSLTLGLFGLVLLGTSELSASTLDGLAGDWVCNLSAEELHLYAADCQCVWSVR